MRITRKQFSGFFVQILLFIITILIYSSNLGTITMNSSLYKILAFYSFFSLIIQLIINIIFKVRFFSAYNILIVFSYLYNCGQVWLTALGISLKKNSFIITYYSAESIISALFIFLIMINTLNIGGLVYRLIKANPNQTVNTIEKQKHSPINNVNSILVYVLFIACVFVLTYNDSKQILMALKMGVGENVYALTYKIGRDNPIIYLAIYMYPVSVLLVLFVAKNKWLRRFAMLHAVIRSIAMMFIIGSRMAYLPLLMCLLIFYSNTLKNKFSTKKIIALLACLGIMYSMVSATRDNVNKFDVETSFSYLVDNNFIVDILQEMGSTQVDLILLYDNTPDKLPYAVGKSFLGSFMSLVPGGELFISDMKNYVDLGSILNNYFHKGESLGGSYIGELYYNFGYVAFLLAPIIGCVFMIIEVSISNAKPRSIMSQAMSIYLLYICLIYIRGQSYDLLFGLKIGFYVLVLNFIFKIIFKNKVRGSQNEKNQRNYKKAVNSNS